MPSKIPRAVSGYGQEIFEKIHKPLLASSTNFDRVSSFFGPNSLAMAISEIALIWKSGGNIRLILSPADTSEIHQALENIIDDDERKVSTVGESIEIAIRNLKADNPEIVTALEEMLISNLLQVAVVVPREGNGLFHSKFSIYHIRADSEISQNIDSGISKYVAVHGSFNESESGYSRNIEDASTHRSWNSSEYDVARVFKLRFDELWNDFAPDTISIPITNILRDALDITEGEISSREIQNQTIGTYLRRISNIPSSIGFDESIWLMPHQISVVNSAMSYTPVRSMLCDEVGLGKTIQAGAIMSRLISEKLCQRVLIIAPAATLTQWAIEISSKFGIPVSLYRNRFRERYLMGQLIDEQWLNSSNEDPKQLVDRNQVSIISSQWFRMRENGYVKELAEYFEMMILDEAHHARLDNWKKREGTKLHKTIKYISLYIENVLLLTATPFQTGESDYLSLLDILQTVKEHDEEDLRIGAGVVSGKLPWNRSQQAELVRSITRRLELVKPHISTKMYDTLVNADKPLGLGKLSKIIEEFEIDENLLFKTLPTTLSTFRNTRNMLREIGMGFPDVIFEAIAVEPKEYEEVLNKSENFIMKYLGGKEFSSGLTRSLYYQRAISSIAALHSTLSNRSDNILITEIEKADYELDLERMPPTSAIEIERIELLLDELEEVMEKYPDPKLAELEKLIEKMVGEQRRTLIFSRYTATTSTIESELWNKFPNISIGRYDGQHIRIRKAGQSSSEDVTKDILINRLMNDEIDVIVCSDAASEGLNLQSASALINVDVPWNPARVMQRIGRIDRLGQLSSSVMIYNLVYFGSIEERMYRVLDNRQTEAIRYLGEHPEMLQTPESREMYQVFGVPIRERVDARQSEIRGSVTLEPLLRACEHQESYLSLWVKSIIDQNPQLNLDGNPASKLFAMRNNTILNSNLKLHSGINGEIGYAICENGVRHALLVKLKASFIPLTPSILLIPEHESELMSYTLEEAVEIYSHEFSAIQSHQRSPGLMSERFPKTRKQHPEYIFEKS